MLDLSGLAIDNHQSGLNKNATKYASGNANQASCNTSKDSPP